MFSLYPHQVEAVEKMKNGCILCGGVGTGKSRTALAYFFYRNGGAIDTPYTDYEPMNDPPMDLYIITTARKRDKLEWDEELVPFLISSRGDGLYSHKVVIDSWNNIKKYEDVKNGFFIFDEQRVVGKGQWVKSFINIARSNEWILLSATPGDTWLDYIPVFVANGFYKNRTHFLREHVVFNRMSKFPKVDKYINTGRLLRLRNSVLINMEYKRHTVVHNVDITVNYDKEKYKYILKNRWNIYEDKPIQNAAELCYTLRRCVNSDDSREIAILELFDKHSRVIIFYNYDYELEILQNMYYGENVEVTQWNGHKHQDIPSGKKWVYLVQYNAGAEGWNCIKTDTIIFYSQNYSYKMMEQARGRIDRLNTPYIDLYYYHLRSFSGIDNSIKKALSNKKKFNETNFERKVRYGQ